MLHERVRRSEMVDEKELEYRRIIAANVRAHRRACNMTLETLAGALGITYQQLQKYETGSNRVSADRLWRIADLLGISVDQLYGIAPLPREEGFWRLEKAYEKAGSIESRARLLAIVEMFADRDS